jgi:capping protein alpha
MSDDGVEEISNEEKLQIAKHYLLSSPPGQFQEVLSDVKKIVGESVLTEGNAYQYARLANTRNSKVVVSSTGKKSVVHSAAEVGQDQYFDPHEEIVFQLNHLTLEATPSDAATPACDEEVSTLRRALQSKASSYTSTSHVTESSGAGVFVKDGNFVIVLSGEKTNLKNFWSGKWTSTWSLKVDGSSAELSGDAKLHVHYFEDGNLQMQSSKNCPASTFSFSSPEKLAEEVFSRIQAFENSLQTGLEDMYNNMNNETFKSLRRIMPISKTKMDWNINAVRMVRQVRK